MATAQRVVVTGASGKLGRFVVEHLAEAGYSVAATDRVAPPGGLPGDFTVADLTDLGQVVELLSGVDERRPADAVVHLSAIPAPGLATNAATFGNNVPSTYNVLRAAQVLGIRNVVTASSETVLGLPFDVPPPYLPVDEEYDVLPQSTYSLGKSLEEEMARHFARWDPTLKVAALRFSNVMRPQDYAQFPAWQDDPRARRWNLWGYIDGRDGAQAVRRALEADFTGFEAFVIANADTVMERDSAGLAAEVFPDVPLRRPLEGRETLLGIDKARRMLGYEPEHSWRQPPPR
ncbi:NAD-dependent epimerase/dehydratase family protein [Promicromonospora citrea]|uniref:UDP-glucose 4-epimerase n=1 Tax=Promicromonospora citrea TaxID=43677 RepID=A0A8H9L362_9MICO|nr:NAD(P)-dependent oxidoreductase [Promicromonospora citrea]NNH53672.1 NAD(P)-dependent oxidoreductase [Promicromonospora citrea]GGM10640.1 UDP-glucose 4-epimerase [Promicromonospora citrea]